MGAEQSLEEDYRGDQESRELDPKSTRVVDFSRFSGNPQEFIRFFRAWRARTENMFAEGRIVGATHADCCSVLANNLPSGDNPDMRVKVHEFSMEELRRFLDDRGLNKVEPSILASQDRRTFLSKIEEYFNTPTSGRLIAEKYIYNSLVLVAQPSCPTIFDNVNAEDPLRGSKIFDRLRHHFIQSSGVEYYNEKNVKNFPRSSSPYGCVLTCSQSSSRFLRAALQPQPSSPVALC
jgi:hypothetical protein